MTASLNVANSSPDQVLLATHNVASSQGEGEQTTTARPEADQGGAPPVGQLEQWLPIVDHDGYEVSSHGRVRSSRRWPGRVLRGTPDTNNYLTVTLCGPGRQDLQRVHCLVAAAFVGPRPAGADVRHIDGDKRNNTAGNLVYGSRAENILDQVRHGVHNNASRTHCAKGHPFDDANTYRRPNGRDRDCRACTRERQRAAAGVVR